MATKKAAPIGGTTAGSNPNQGATQPPWSPGKESGVGADNREAGTKASQGMQFSGHPGHGSAKKTMAGEKHG